MISISIKKIIYDKLQLTIIRMKLYIRPHISFFIFNFFVCLLSIIARFMIDEIIFWCELLTNRILFYVYCFKFSNSGGRKIILIWLKLVDSKIMIGYNSCNVFSRRARSFMSFNFFYFMSECFHKFEESLDEFVSSIKS